MKLYKGDCLEVMDRMIAEGVKVDAIITDPPYGTTACKWDSIIPFNEMWERLNKLIKPNGAIVLFGSEPFSSALRMSNIKNYKYDWVWVRNNATKYLSRSYNPLSIYETISVFLKNENEELGIYLKQKRLEKGLSKKYLDNKLGSNTLYSFFEGRNLRGVITYSKISITHYEVLKLLLNLDDRYDEYIYNTHTLNHQGINKLKIPKIQKARKEHRDDSFYSYNAKGYKQEYENYPKDVLYFNTDNNRLHPTQKPVALMEYLIKTYTNEGETVLDFTMGSGTTGVAAKNLGRKFIGIELDPDYFKIAEDRIDAA